MSGVSYEQIVKEDLNIGVGTVSVTMPGGGSAVGSQIGLHTFTNWFSLLDYGAVADGLSNASDALTSALSDLSSAGGGTLVLPSGALYLSKTQFTVPDNTRIVGGGPNTNLLSDVAAANSVFTSASGGVTQYDAFKVTLQNAAGRAFHLVETRGGTLLNNIYVTQSNTSNTSVAVQVAKDTTYAGFVRILNCYFTNLYVGVDLSDTVTEFLMMGSSVIGGQSGGGPAIADSIGLAVVNNCSTIRAIGNRFEGLGTGIQSRGTYINSIGNAFETCGTYWQDIQPGSGNSNRVWGFLAGNSYSGSGANNIATTPTAQIINLDIALDSTLPNGLTTGTFDAVGTYGLIGTPTTFAGLPAAPAQGYECNITDCSTGTWGATAAGSGSTKAKVRYNGTNWTVVGV